MNKALENNKGFISFGLMAIIGALLVGGAAIVFLAAKNSPEGNAESQESRSGTTDGKLKSDKTNAADNKEKAESQKNSQSDRLTGAALLSKASPVAVGDLKIGEQIVAMGAVNQDGSVTARSIFIGDAALNFRGLGEGNQSGAQDRRQGQGFQRPEGFEGRQLPEGFDPESFQNLTPEERQARSQKLQESGQFPQFSGGASRSGRSDGFRNEASIVRGKIIAVDDTSITISLSEGGSRIVLYSEQTTITKDAK